MPEYPDLSAVRPSAVSLLVGAGGSWRTGLPLAHDVLDALLHEVVDDSDQASELVEACGPGRPGARNPFDYLRFETVMSWVAELIDPQLELLRIFELADDPSPLQRRFARMAIRGSRLVTVNFDDLLERALQREGAAPRTLDAHTTRTPRLSSEVPVLKLHGSLVRHGGGRRRGARTPLHATLEIISSRSPGLMLATRAAERLREAVDGRFLVVIGYSAADDLDVVPALAKLRPAGVVWIDHAPGRVRLARPRARGGANPSRDALLAQLTSAGVEVHLVRGPTERVLESIGLGRIETPAPPSLPWRKTLEGWARDRRDLLHDGMPFAAMLWGELEDWERKRRALRRAAAPRGHIRRQPWTAAKRAYELGETAFLSGGSVRVVRRWGERSLALAEEDHDEPSQGRALLLLGRAEAAAGREERAVDRYVQAMDVLDPSSIEWANAAERCANALVFAGRHREALSLAGRAITVLRRRGILDALVDAHHDRGMAYRSLGRVAEAARAFSAAEAIAHRFPMAQQHFAAAAMLGESLRLMGDLSGARAALVSALRSARYAFAYPSEIAMAHHFLARVEIDSRAPERASRHLSDAGRALDAAGDRSPGLSETRMLQRLHAAELELWRGRRARARKRFHEAVMDGPVAHGEPRATVTLLEHLLEPTQATAVAVDRVLEELRSQEVTVFADFCVTLALLGRAQDASLRAHIRAASDLLLRWGNSALAGRLTAASS
ncbi:MAG: SIR2 family protein [Actinomycetota bacterium]|nr:SIR2 family protein [Actinomycetota bacterium]